MAASNMSASTAVSNLTDHRFPWRWNLADLPAPTRGNVFSCFSCGGGSSMGYKLAGFNVVGCCEIDPAMMAVYKANNHPKHSYLMDIRDFAALDDYPEELHNLDILDGSPPCSVFSMAGKREAGWGKEKKFREGQKEQRLDDLFFYYIRVAEKLRPRVVVAENVKGIVQGNARGYVREIFQAFNAAGYDVQLFLLNAARMGVPQSRERAVFIGRRKDLNLPEIKVAFSEKPILFGEVREAEGVPFSPGVVMAELLALRRPTDTCMADISKRVRRKNAGFTAPINRDGEPAHTITSGSTLLRGYDGRKMTDRDIINCQTFPQDYNFNGQSVQYVCGMSVPPVMMANLAESIAEQLLK